jgi:ATP/maltotriose-dependent transcriptional regulator MalT
MLVLLEPLGDTEIPVLRCLPTNLSMPEIAGELYVSANTVKTHIRNHHVKLGGHPGRGRRAHRRPGLLVASGLPR